MIAVGIMAAWHGERIKPDIALTGVMTNQGCIGAVGGLPRKLEAAAWTNILHILLVPQGQGKTPAWDLFRQGQQRNIEVVERGT